MAQHEMPSNQRRSGVVGNVRLASAMDRRTTTSPRSPTHSTRRSVIKSVLLGDYEAGKSTLFRKLKAVVEKETSSTPLDSQSIDKCSRSITTADSKTVQLDVWDTGGAERYRTFTLEYFRKSTIVFLVYRLDRPQSLTHLRGWINDATGYIQPGAIFVLIGNLFIDNRVDVSVESAEDFAKCWDIQINVRFSVKSVDDEVLTGILERAVDQVLKDRAEAIPVPEQDTINLGETQPLVGGRRRGSTNLGETQPPEGGRKRASSVSCRQC